MSRCDYLIFTATTSLDNCLSIPYVLPFVELRASLWSITYSNSIFKPSTMVVLPNSKCCVG